MRDDDLIGTLAFGASAAIEDPLRSENPDSYSLLSCYEGKTPMAQHCAICLGQGRLAYRLSREGKSLDEIRAAIDEEFAEE